MMKLYNAIPKYIQVENSITKKCKHKHRNLFLTKGYYNINNNLEE